MKTAMKKTAVLIMILASVLSMFTACGRQKQKLNMSDYVSVTFSGDNKHGRPFVHFDTLRFESDVMSGWQGTGSTRAKAGELTMLEMSIDYKANRTDYLRNGDKVKITITFDEEKARELGVSLGGLTGTFKVKGLK